MKLLIFFLLISFASNGQLRLYAERKNVDNTIDSFYVSIIADSVRDKNGVAICPTVESFIGQFEPQYPQSFGQFVRHADGIYRNARYYSGYPVSVIPIYADAGTNLVLTDQPNSEQPLANSQRSSVRVDTRNFQQFRLTAIVMALSASVNSPRIYIQYSLDGNNWTGNGAQNISLTTTGAKETTWIDLPVEAIGDIYVRVVQNGGNGTADPALGNITIQFR